MKQLIKGWLSRLMPETTAVWMAQRSRAHSHRIVAEWGCREINRKLIDRYGRQVLAGPFQGLTITPAAEAEQIGPHLLGLYESALNPFWERLFDSRPTQVVDVGSKFGYFAVGLARRFPGVPVVAFDIDGWARRATLEMAKANGVSNVTVEGFCRPAWFATALRPGAMVLSDCEGYEANLFTEATLPHLATATLIIETHDQFAPGVTTRLRSLFAATHEVELIDETGVTRESPRPLDFLSERERELATQEVRGNQFWLFCHPRTHGALA